MCQDRDSPGQEGADGGGGQYRVLPRALSGASSLAWFPVTQMNLALPSRALALSLFLSPIHFGQETHHSHGLSTQNLILLSSLSGCRDSSSRSSACSAGLSAPSSGQSLSACRGRCCRWSSSHYH